MLHGMNVKKKNILIGSFLVSDFTSTGRWLTIQCFFLRLQKVVFWKVTGLLTIPSTSTTLPLIYVHPGTEGPWKYTQTYKKIWSLVCQLHWDKYLCCTIGALHFDQLQSGFKVYTNGCQWIVVLLMFWLSLSQIFYIFWSHVNNLLRNVNNDCCSEKWCFAMWKGRSQTVFAVCGSDCSLYLLSFVIIVFLYIGRTYFLAVCVDANLWLIFLASSMIHLS
jgi:hypothetical protein